MRTARTLLGCLLALAAISGCAQHQHAKVTHTHGVAASTTDRAATAANQARAQTSCPVMGKKINPNIWVEHQGRKIFLCCPGCKTAFKANPAKYAAKVK